MIVVHHHNHPAGEDLNYFDVLLGHKRLNSGNVLKARATDHQPKREIEQFLKFGQN